MKIKFAYIVYAVYLSAMKKELTKGDVYVVVDTPKKAKKLKKVLDMFGERIYDVDRIAIDNGSYHTGTVALYDDYDKIYIVDDEWYIYSHTPSGRTKVSIKELRNILAKEHLKKGDYVVLSNGLIGKIIKPVAKSEILVLDNENDNVTCSIEDFKRYATHEEIALLDPQQGLCSLCKSKLGIK